MARSYTPNKTPLEKVEHRMLVGYLEALRLDYFHPANEAKRSYKAAHALKLFGMKAGVPDFLIFTPPPAKPLARGVAIEMKRQRGWSVSPEQHAWLTILERCGWLVRVCRGADDAIDWLRELGFEEQRHASK